MTPTDRGRLYVCVVALIAMLALRFVSAFVSPELSWLEYLAAAFTGLAIGMSFAGTLTSAWVVRLVLFSLAGFGASQSGVACKGGWLMGGSLWAIAAVAVSAFGIMTLLRELERGSTGT